MYQHSLLYQLTPEMLHIWLRQNNSNEDLLRWSAIFARRVLTMLTTSRSKNPGNSSEMMFLCLLARGQFFRWVDQPIGLPRIAQVLLLLTWKMSLQYRAKKVPKEPQRSQASMRAPEFRGGIKVINLNSSPACRVMSTFLSI